MRLNADEYLRLTIVREQEKRVMDIRVWKNTPTGGVPTRKSIIISKKLIVPLIRGLQKIHQAESAIEARNTTEITHG